MKVVTYIAEFLKAKGIKTVFELQGGMITRIVDELYHHGCFTIVSMHHEQAASFAADAYARVTNKPGVALATSGPGATNLITGIGSCYFDSVPAIFITGQVNINEQKGDKDTRQLGFQETDIVSIVKPITKAAFAIKKAEDVPIIFEEAYDISTNGRPGPVLIDIPMNLQNTEIEPIKNINANKRKENKNELEIFFNEFKDALKYSKKPLVLAGRGIQISNVKRELQNFIEAVNLPLVCSLLGLDVIPYNHQNRIGFIGTYGNRWANYALGTCDLLLVLGSRLDLRQTGADIKSFTGNKAIFHVDIDKAELNNRIENCKILKEDLKIFFKYMQKQKLNKQDTSVWFQDIKEKYLLRPDTIELENIKGINPNIFIHRLSQFSAKAKAFISDVGNNQMWTAQSIEIMAEQLFLTSGGMGSMGYALPAAIGACFALNRAPIVSIIGDGGFQINIQEFQTIKRNNLPIKMVILNNRCLGMIRQFQDSYFDSCYQSTVWGYDAPDFANVAKAYKISSASISRQSEIEEGLDLLWKDPEIPFLLNVDLDVHTNVYPKMMYGYPITNMEPEFDLNKLHNA